MPRIRLALTIAVLLAAADAAPVNAEWSPALAARYLDARQKEWFAWKTAQSADGPCVTCHTGMTYLLARPALRRALHEAEPTEFETGLLNRLRTKLTKPAEGALGTVEAVFGAMFLDGDDARTAMSSHRKQAFDRLWELQEADGPGKGGWQWYEANLDPWENPESGYYGASLVALALGNTPEPYRQDHAIQAPAASLIAFLANPPSPPRLHDRLALLWASTSTLSLFWECSRSALIAATLARPPPDGARPATA